MSAVLRTEGLSKRFGALKVTQSVDLSLAPGARHALIGPNGAGKTTFINLLSGALSPDAGSVWLDGQDVTRLSEATRTAQGLVRTFQINQLFKRLSVLENITLALAEKRGVARSIWRPLGAYRDLVETALGVLEPLGLADDAARPVDELAYGRQRLVEIAIAVALEPRVLLLDEPAAGVPADDAERILASIETLGEAMAVLIIEHDMDVVFRFADEITVLVDGAVLVSGTPDEIANDAQVRAIYLGEAR